MYQCFSNIRLFLPAVLSFKIRCCHREKKKICLLFHPCTTWLSLSSKHSKSVTGESFPWLPEHLWSLTSAGNGFQAHFCLTSEPCKILMRCVFCFVWLASPKIEAKLCLTMKSPLSLAVLSLCKFTDLEWQMLFSTQVKSTLVHKSGVSARHKGHQLRAQTLWQKRKA